MALQLERRLFTVDEYHKMLAAGILTEDDRIELIEGEIVAMAPIGAPHAACVKRLRKLLDRLIGNTAELGIQDPIQLGDLSEPQPDVSLLKARSNLYSDEHPTAEDIFLLIEVADKTLATDRSAKLPMYARGGIAEVWIVNLPEDLVEVFSSPSRGAYRQTVLARRGETLAVPGIVDGYLSVDDILG